MPHHENPMHNYASAPSARELKTLIEAARNKPAMAWQYLNSVPSRLPSSQDLSEPGSRRGNHADSAAEQRDLFTYAVLDMVITPHREGLAAPSDFFKLLMRVQAYNGGPDYEVHQRGFDFASTAFNAKIAQMRSGHNAQDCLTQAGQMALCYADMVVCGVDQCRTDPYSAPYRTPAQQLEDLAALATRHIKDANRHNLTAVAAQLMLPGLAQAISKGYRLEHVYGNISRQTVAPRI